ncbi:transglutaminase-like domain-containing protein [Planctomycetes bacterium K23_9]|uniref:Transglutaminase-like superfamily protein n=1 Tax=Stieleria marina TaxID=1930275 RepID=A0A517NX05_9BACT|nr:Transglutaminase-like superfamily protein [Planctomycetes bacterium K23_9]
MHEFLIATEIVDFGDNAIRNLAQELRQAASDDVSIAAATFRWVRDNVQHSLDHQRTEVTCRASDVLHAGTGYCYAKSHLLAALLRANKIPAGFCYQRLTVSDDQPPYCLHGLNAVYLADFGWYRIDARGNKPGVDAQFVPPIEQLAFSTEDAGEMDFLEIWPQPLPIVLRALQTASSVQELANCLPDAVPHEMETMRKSATASVLGD